MRRLLRNSVARRAMLAVIALAIGALYVTSRRATSAEDLTRQAKIAWAENDRERAAALLERALERSPTFEPALLLAADLALKDRRPEDALGHYRRLDRGRGDGLADDFTKAGNVALKLGRARDAEFFFRRVLEERPHDETAHRRLAALLVAEGRRWESAPHLWEMIRLRRFSLEDLALLGNLDELFDGTELLRFFERSVPDDPTPLTGLARLALHKSEIEEAERLLRKIVAHSPEHIEAQTNLGKLLSDSGRRDEFLRWHSALPASADGHPGIWTARAAFAQSQGDAAGAIRCYWEAIRRDPNLRVAHYQLSHLLVSEGEPTAAELFAQRAKSLEALAAITYDTLTEGPDLDNFREAAELTEELGRPWEAWAWNLATTVHFPQQAAQAHVEASRLEKELHASLPRTLPSANLAQQVDLSRFALPEWAADAKAAESSERPPSEESNSIRFATLPTSAGLAFTYRNGASGPGMQIYQSVGGGVAVVDYDVDGWPDVVFPQAGDWPPQPSDTSYADQFFRNSGGTRFEDVSHEVGVSDGGYGLGAAVGDLNSDGFPDLYITNIGPNRLLVNNGDGTFTDATESAGIQGEQWTSSAAMVDLDGDTLPDLYDANYCAGPEPFEHRCDNAGAGGARTCKPTLFRAEPDRIHINEGGGRFKDVTVESGTVENDGRGLGVVAFDPDEDGLLSVFVANDMTANFYWVNEASAPGSPLKLEERGVLSGLAFDFDGRPQACMGIAADDADGDGRLDLFVTNYFNEPNTLYLQRSPEVFVDATRPSGLREPSLPMLGFGTEFLDADLDGWPDLVVVNGHVDDFSDSGMPFRMPAQFFKNRRGRFTEIPSQTVGSYFTDERLGRGLARLDWNRDGLEDFLVSHLFEPAALEQNVTASAGRSLSLRFVGTQSCRDAVGVTVRVTAGGRERMKQLVGGGGYQSSNQQQLVFGLGNSGDVESLRVRWPSGRVQIFDEVPADAEYVVVEGRERLLPVTPSHSNPALAARR